MGRTPETAPVEQTPAAVAPGNENTPDVTTVDEADDKKAYTEADVVARESEAWKLGWSNHEGAQWGQKHTNPFEETAKPDGWTAQDNSEHNVTAEDSPEK